MFPISCKVIFPVLFVLFKAETTVSKLILHQHSIWQDKVWNLEGYMFSKFFFLFLPLENFGLDLRFLCSGRFSTCAMRWHGVYCLSKCVEISRRTRVPVIGNETGRLVQFVDLCRKWINKSETCLTWHILSETWAILKRDIAADSLKIWCENFNPVKS